MNINNIASSLTLALALIPAAFAAEQSTPAEKMGLSKTSVFDTPAQQVYQPSGTAPGNNALLPRAYLNAPPQVPHDISDFLPITADNNMCIACHNQPGLWGSKPAKGTPTPIPKSHYTDQRNAPGVVTENLVGARYTCSQCHVMQMNAKPLVENSFGKKTSR